MRSNDTIEHIEIPDDAVIIKQSIWAWLLMAIPWVLFFLISIRLNYDKRYLLNSAPLDIL